MGADHTHAYRRLLRLARRHARAWNVQWWSPSGDVRTMALLGTEREVMDFARELARRNGATRWATYPFPEFNSRYSGAFEAASCPDWVLVRSP